MQIPVSDIAMWSNAESDDILVLNSLIAKSIILYLHAVSCSAGQHERQKKSYKIK